MNNNFCNSVKVEIFVLKTLNLIEKNVMQFHFVIRKGENK